MTFIELSKLGIFKTDQDFQTVGEYDLGNWITVPKQNNVNQYQLPFKIGNFKVT